MTLLDPSRGRENFRRHQWAKTIVDNWKQTVSFALEQDRDFFEAMIPTLTPWPEYGQNCPACVERLSSMGECRLYEWEAPEPDKLTCRYCRTTYPNDRYPEAGSIRAQVMGQSFSYYLTEAEQAHPEDRSGRYAFRWSRWPVHTSFSGVIRSKKAGWCVNLLEPLAGLYVLTGDLECARRVGWILEIFASRYPHYLFHSYDGTYADCPPAEAAASMGTYPRGGRFAPEVIITAFEGRHLEGNHAVLNNGFWGAGRLNCSGGDAGFLLRAIMAYDMTRDSGLYSENKIRSDLLLPGCKDMEWWDEINNKCGPGRALSAAAGILFDRPASIRRAKDGLDALMDRGFGFDGFCTESPGYSGMHLNLLRNIPELLAQGATGIETDPFASHPRYRLALESMITMLDPSLRNPVLGDTRAGTGMQPVHVEVLAAHYGDQYASLLEHALGASLDTSGDEYALWHRDPELSVQDPETTKMPLPSRTMWFPGWQVAALRGEQTATHTVFYFNATPFGPHRHYDTLSIIYVAHGKELAADRGYIWDDPRNAWTKSTLAHNLVVVDGENQSANTSPSRLELFGRGPGIEVVQASADPYTQCDTYRRTCVLVEVEDSQSYVVDVFSVRGGSEHQYCFHCNGDLTDLSGVAMTGTKDAISSLENVRTGIPTGACTARWEFEGTNMDLILLTPPQRLLLADAPGWRSDEGEEMHAPPVQQILAERRGENLVSQFVAVMAPHEGNAAPVLSAELLVSDPITGACCVAVNRPGYTDYVAISTGGEKLSCKSLDFDGRFGFVSVESGKHPVRGYLLDGKSLSFDDWSLSRPSARTRVPVSTVTDRTFYLAEPLPAGAAIPGSYLLADPTGFVIESATRSSITTRDYPVQPVREVILLHQAEYQADDASHE